MTPRWQSFLRWGVLLVALGFGVRLLARQLAGLDVAAIQIDWPWLAAALAVNLLYVAFYAGLWQQLAAAVGLALPAREAWGVYFCSVAGKYLPLRVAGLGYRAWSYRRRGGWSLGMIAGALYFETILVLGSGIAVAAALSPWSQWRAIGLTPATWAVSFVALAGLIIAPRVLPVLARRKPESSWLQSVAEIGRTTGYLRFFWRYAAAWLLLGLGLMLAIRGLGGAATPAVWLHASWSYAIAGLAGMLVVFAPAGIGVRDGVLALALATAMPPAQAAVCAITARLLILVAEMTCAVAGSWLLHRAAQSDTSAA